MPSDVLRNKTRDEEVRVVVSVLHTQCQLLAALAASLLQKLGPQLLGEELVGEPLIDEDLIEIATRHA